MRIARQIVFRYDGDPTTEETDLDGDKSVPKQGSVIDRRGKRWTVVQVNMERSETGPFEVPILQGLPYQ